MTEASGSAGSSVESVETPMGVAVLSAAPDDGPLRVRGVALSENDITRGASGKVKFWSRDAIEPAVEGLVGTKIVDDREHDIPSDATLDDIPDQPSVETIVGEVTDAKYEPGIGVVYEGEVDDPDVAALVDNGRVEVSPFVFHRMGEADENGVAPVKEIRHWRDLAVVSEGAGSNASIEPAGDRDADGDGDSSPESTVPPSSSSPQPAVAAMSAAALTAVLDNSFDDSAADDTVAEETVVSDESTEPAADEGADDADADADGPGDATAGDATDAVDDADADADGDGDDDEVAADGADSGVDGEGESGVNEPAESGVDGDEADSTTIDMDLTEDEEKFVNKMRALDNPTVVEADIEALADTAEELEVDQYEEPQVIEGTEFDEPQVVESEEFNSLSERVELIEDFMAKRLAERTGMKEETAGALSLNAMFSEFEDDEGEFDAEALVQDPVSGDSGGDTSSPDEEDAEALKATEEEDEEIAMQLEALKQKRDVLGNTSVAPRLDEKIEALENKQEGI